MDLSVYNQRTNGPVNAHLKSRICDPSSICHTCIKVHETNHCSLILFPFMSHSYKYLPAYFFIEESRNWRSIARPFIKFFRAVFLLLLYDVSMLSLIVHLSVIFSFFSNFTSLFSVLNRNRSLVLKSSVVIKRSVCWGRILQHIPAFLCYR